MDTQYDRVATALHWMVRHQQEQPELADIAAQVGWSEAHLQKTFQEFVGVSPKQFLKFLTREQALQRLRRGATVLDATWDSGLSSPGRLHDLLVTTTALTPGEARRGGKGVSMDYGVGATPFGPSLLAWTSRGITFLAFCESKPEAQALEELKAQWPDADLHRDDRQAAKNLSGIFDGATQEPLRLWLRGSPFQLAVWEALLTIPAGAHTTYGNLARLLGKPKASRAVGTAVGRNPVCWLIPCHRVITRTAALGGYRWGPDTKQALIGFEAARCRAA